MNLLNFIEQFTDEESCKLKYKEVRDNVGIACAICGSKDHYWKSDKWQYECKKCGKRTTLRSGTAMHTCAYGRFSFEAVDKRDSSRPDIIKTLRILS